jgi:hypothetical protein
VPGRDTRWQAVDRPTLKRKHSRFDDARSDGSSAWSARPALSEAEWRQLVTSLVTPARVVADLEGVSALIREALQMGVPGVSATP